MRILVTGGAGFVGSHLCERLLKEGHDVMCLDNLSSGSRENVRGRFFEQSVTEPFTEEVDQIYNLACLASPKWYQSDPIGTTLTSVVGSQNMLVLARENNAKVLLTSTSEVYGDPLQHPQKETYWGNVNPNGVRSCYDEGKRCAESLFLDHRRVYGTDAKIVRIFNTYGERMQPDDGRVVSNFITQALRGDDITIYGDGRQTRSFQYVSDLVEGLIRVMNSDTNEPINLGNPCEFTILELAEKVIALTHSSSKIVYKPLPADDPKVRRPDITKAKTLLGWQPVVGLEEGLKRTIDYFRSIQ